MIAWLNFLFAGREPGSAASASTAGRILAAMRAAHALALLLIALLAVASAAATLRFVEDSRSRQDRAEAAAGQLTLAHRIALLAAAATAPAADRDPAVPARHLREAIAQMAASHARLAQDAEGRAPADALLRDFLAAAARIAEDPGHDGASQLASLLRLQAAGPLFDALQGTVLLHRQAADAALRRLTGLGYAQLALLGLLLLVQTLLVFRPLAQQVERMARRLERDALTDPLTRLPNRRAFLRAVAAARGGGAPAGGALVLLDLARLRDINESAGQAAGDAALREFAARLVPAAAEQPLVAGRAPLVFRLAGDEFGVLLPQPAEGQRLADIAARLCFAVTAVPFEHQGRPIPLRAAAGATPILDGDPLEALRAADLALRDARHDGRLPVRVFDPRRDRRRLEARRAVLDAFAAGDLHGVRAELQPQLAARDLTVVGFEALARWTHPAFGPIAPGVFLPLAAEAGHLPALGRAVRRSAFATLAGLRRAGLPAPRLALNLSAGELASPGLVAELEGDLEAIGLVPADIEIEITEEVVADGIEPRTLERLKALQRAGAGILLDDFGTGAASFAQLLRMQVQAIKIDRSFVQAIGAERRGEVLVQATIRFAHTVGAEVVAEGVETEAQLDFLRHAGCDTVQGWLLAREMPPAALQDWLLTRARPGYGQSSTAAQPTATTAAIEGSSSRQS